METTRTPDARLLDVLHASADWALVYWDDNSAVYVARAADRAEFLSRAYVYAVRPDRFEPDLLETPSGLARAERDYDRKLKEAPDCVLALQGKAQCLQERGDTAAAVPLLGKAVALRPENAGLAYNLGAVLLTMNDLDEAATWFRRTLALHEYEAEAYMALGMIGQHKGDTAQALECYAEVLTRAAENWKVYWNLSVLFEESGDLDDALGAARDVVRLQPKNRAALERLRALAQKKQAGGTP